MKTLLQVHPDRTEGRISDLGADGKRELGCGRLRAEN
jgi:hypothetical protein